MVTDKIKELAAARAEVAQLERSISVELNRELGALPAQYGFDSVNAFFSAVRTAFGKRRGPKLGAAKATAAKPAAPAKRRKRAKITDATRAEVKQLVAAGKTGAEIAKTVGISLPSVQNIKKALGLVGGKKKK